MGKLIKETSPRILKDMDNFRKAYYSTRKTQKEIAEECDIGLSAVWKFNAGYKVGGVNLYQLRNWIARNLTKNADAIC